jgi:hypothetical protein
MLSQNIANKLPTYATQHPSGAMCTQTPWNLASLSPIWRPGYDHKDCSKLTLMNDILNLCLKEAMKVFVKYMPWSITDSPVCNCLDRNFLHPVCKLWSCLIWNLTGCILKSLIILSEEYKLISSLLCNVLSPAVLLQGNKYFSQTSLDGYFHVLETCKFLQCPLNRPVKNVLTFATIKAYALWPHPQVQ